MHEHGVAHRDCSMPNILMDGERMYPHGFHPVHDMVLPDGETWAWPYSRSQVGVRYYFVDYGISSYFPPDHPRELVTGDLGRDQDVPELSETIPYDPFPVDIFTIGHVFRDELYQVRLAMTSHRRLRSSQAIIEVRECRISSGAYRRLDAARFS